MSIVDIVVAVDVDDDDDVEALSCWWKLSFDDDNNNVGMVDVTTSCFVVVLGYDWTYTLWKICNQIMNIKNVKKNNDEFDWNWNNDDDDDGVDEMGKNR